MALEFIPNQPILFTEDVQLCKNTDSSAYAQLLQQDDMLCIQLKNSPCGDSLFNCVDTNWVANPDFEDAADWILSTGWTIALGYLSHVSGSTTTAFATPSLITATWYAVTFTIENYVSGEVRPTLDGTPGTSPGTYRDANGTYTENIYYDGTGTGSVGFEPTTDFVGSISFVFAAYASGSTCLTCVPTNNNLVVDGDFSSSGSWNVTTGWTIGGGVASHAGISTGTLSQIITPLINSATYAVTFTIKNYVSGTTRVQLGNGTGVNQGTARSANGTYTESLTLNTGDTTLYFTLLAGTNVFDIDDVFVLDLASGCVAAGIWQIIPDGYEYHHTTEIVGLQTNVGTMGYAGTTYQVQFRVQGSTTGGITPGWLWDSDFTNHVFGTAVSGNGLFTFYTTPEEDSSLSFTPSADFDGLIVTADISVKVMNYDHTVTLLDADGDVATTIYDSADTEFPILFHEDYMTWCADWNEFPSLEVPGEDLPSGCYTLLVLDACAVELYESTTVVNYKKTGTHDCSVFVEATCNELGAGFYFGDGFSLNQRLRLLRISPKYPTDQESYIYSTGLHKRVYAAGQKLYTAWFDKVDEWAHDVIRTQFLLCDNVSIDTVAYFCPDDSYEPEWTDNMSLNLTKSRINLQRVQDVIYNRNL